jgi:hypothetical protein
MATSLILLQSGADEGVAAGFALGGLGVGVVGLSISIGADDRLSRAVWWYNRLLVPGRP